MSHRTVCLTGATGLVGSHILFALAQESRTTMTTTTVVCPIRAECVTHAARRLSSLKLLQPLQAVICSSDSPTAHHHSSSPQNGLRILPVPCDLAASDAEHRMLAAAPSGGFDVTIHCAAADGYLQSLQDLHLTNVKATQKVLNVHNASEQAAPHFLHMSTCATRLITPHRKHCHQSPEESLRGFDTHYARTKYAAEQIIKTSLRAGTQGTICEIGYLFDDDLESGWNDSNVVEMIWKVCCRIGCAVQLGEGARHIDMTHAGDLAHAVVQLARPCTRGERRNPPGVEVLNLQRPDAFDWDATVVPALRKFMEEKRRKDSQTSTKKPNSPTTSKEAHLLPYSQWQQRFDAYYSQRRAAGWLRNILTPDSLDQSKHMFSPGSVLPPGGRRLTQGMVEARLSVLCGISK